MLMYFSYILKKFLKNFLIIFFSISFLYSVVDVMFSVSNMPSSSNLFILYFFYMFIYAGLTIYPLSIIFAFLLTLNQMIKFNELVSFYSLGFMPKKILKPFLSSSLIIVLIMFSLQSTKAAYSGEYAEAIKNAKKLSTTNMFLKYKNSIIFIKSLNPILKTAHKMKVFIIENNKVTKIYYAKEAKFRDDKWYCKNTEIMTLSKAQWQKKKKAFYFLQNFKPKIISNLQKLKNISFYDAYLTIKYFKNIDKNTILSIVFFKIFTPLSILALMIFLFIKAPIHIRISNIPLFMLKSLSFSILVWGGMLLVFKFAKQGVLPYWGLVLPFTFLLIIDFIILRRNNEF